MQSVLKMVGGRGRGLRNAAILLLVLCIAPLFATVASVPTSVLAQNSELSSNVNNANANKNNNQNFAPLSKVKRSSNALNANTNTNANNNKDNNAFGTNEIASSMPTPSTLSASNNPDKKSSPEIVPASFSNLPPASNPSLSAAAANAAAAAAAATSNVARQPQAGLYALPSNSEIMAAVEAAASQQQQQQQQYYGDSDDVVDLQPVSTMHKRGISSQQYLYDANLAPAAYSNLDYYNAPYGQGAGLGLADVPNGVWADDVEQPAVYTDLQEIDDYLPMQRAVPGNNRNKAYDNLQNLLNTEAYLESVPLSVPLQYSTRNYGYALDTERNKRGGYYNPATAGASSGYNGNMNKYNKFGEMRSYKRDNTKLTPADMLALVALVEAGERARKETDADAGYLYPGDNYAPKSYAANAGGVYDYGAAGANLPGSAASLDDVDYNIAGGSAAAGAAASGSAAAPNGNWLDAPAVVDYYGVPMNVEAAGPKYDFVPREHKYGGGNRFGSSKRFMVAKKKRSVAKYLNNGDKYY